MILGEGSTATAIRANVGEVDFCWIAWDLKYGESDILIRRAAHYLHELEAGSIVVLSSQVKVGTCAKLEALFPDLWFCVVPENTRASSATEDFGRQARIVFGARRFAEFGPVLDVLGKLTDRIVFMSPESAEMVKHALNGFLAMSCRYARDVARVGEAHGADPDDVALGVMTDARVGELAYLKPEGLAGPHLWREVENLRSLGL